MSHQVQRVVLKVQMWIGTIARAEEGQGLTEYALILVLVSIAAFAALQLLGNNVTSVINEAATKL
jgi:Flp pilus assembly pilin Flp